MSKPTADVSIITANYNNGRYLKAFIESIAISTVWPAELIIVDDGSTDHSEAVIRAYDDLPFLKPVFLGQNLGFTNALNTLLGKATGKYVMRADPDDLLLPGRIEKQTAYLERHPEIDFLGCNCIYFSHSGEKKINQSNFPLSHHDIVRAYQNGEHGLLHATVCGKRTIYQRYRYQPISPGEDYELFARITRDGYRFANLPEPLYMVRVHPESSTSRIKKEAIATTFHFRDQIFGTKTKPIKIWAYYYHIKHYRRSQLSGNPFTRTAHLMLAILFNPKKLLKRLRK